MLILLGAQPAVAADLVAFPAGTVRTIAPGWDGTVSYPVDVSARGTATAVVRAVVQGEQSLDTPVDAAVAKQQLTLTATRPADFSRQGSYLITVRLTVDKQTQTTELTVKRPAAGLTTPGTVKIANEGFFSSSLTGLADSRLSLPLADDTELTEISAGALTPAPGSVVLTLCPPGQKVTDPCTKPLDQVATHDGGEQGGGNLVLGVGLTGDFPYGTTSQQVQLRSPQLAEPLALTFEVRRERPLIVLVGVILAGIGVSVLVRILLPHVVARANVRETRRSLQQQIAELKEGTNDAEFGNALDELARKVGAVDDGSSTASDDLAAVEVALGSLLSEREKALADAQAKLTVAAVALAPTYAVPPTVSAELEDARASLERARQAISVGNLPALESLTPELSLSCRTIQQICADWADGLATAAAALERPISKGLAQAVPQALALAERLASLCKPPPPPPTIPPGASLTEAAAAAAAALARVHTLMISAAPAVTDLSGVADIIVAKDPSKMPERDKVNQAITDNQHDPAALFLDASGPLSALIGRHYGAGDSFAERPLDPAVADFPPDASQLNRPDVPHVRAPRRFEVSAALATTTLGIVVAVVAGIGLYALNLESWTGASGQMVSIFLAAVAIDVTATAVVNVATPADSANPA